jgi:hypothetical protein
MEWTIPFLESAFYLGIHNLPSQGIHSLVQELVGARWRRCREAGASCGSTDMTRKHGHIGASAVEDLLIHLNEQPQTLIVLNHPLRDSGGVGAEAHRALLAAFLGCFGRYIHAVEVNGLRPWAENLAVMDLADRWSLPVISGGDRHGSEPNAILNVTGQTGFQAFVEEIRVDRRSELVFMKQYREPLNLRRMRTVVDLLRESPLNHNSIPEALLQKPSV